MIEKKEIQIEMEHYKKPTDWVHVVLSVTLIIAVAVCAMDILVWRPL